MRRADRIAAFREELSELSRAGVLELEEAELSAVQRFHDEALRALGRNEEVDTGERGTSLSLGMRLVAMLGSVAFAASVVYLFYDVWGRLGLAAQVAVLTAAPIALLVLTAVIARREPAGHFATLAAAAAFGAIWLDVGALAAVSNMRSTPVTALVCGLFGLLLAYAFELRLPLVAGAVSTALFVAGVLAERLGVPWYAALQRPETLLAAGVLCLAATRVPGTRNAAALRPPGFAAIYDVLALVLLLWPPLVLGAAGSLSVLPWSVTAIEIVYEALGFAGGAAALALGIARARKELAYGGALFLLAWIVTFLAHWLWDAVPRSLFFFALTLVAVASLAVLKRVRAALVPAAGVTA